MYRVVIKSYQIYYFKHQESQEIDKIGDKIKNYTR